MKAACRAQHLLWTRAPSRESPPCRDFQQVPEAAAAMSKRGAAHRGRWQEPQGRGDCQGQMSVTALCRKIHLRKSCGHLINCLSLIHPIVLSQVCVCQEKQTSKQTKKPTKPPVLTIYLDFATAHTSMKTELK